MYVNWWSRSSNTGNEYHLWIALAVGSSTFINGDAPFSHGVAVCLLVWSRSSGGAFSSTHWIILSDGTPDTAGRHALNIHGVALFVLVSGRGVQTVFVLLMSGLSIRADRPSMTG